MSLAPMSVEVVLGEFVEKDCGNYFHYSENPDNYEFCKDFPHLVWVGGIGQQYRYANVKKTVAYIAVDEDEYGNAVVEKWKLKKNVQYVQENLMEILEIIFSAIVVSFGAFVCIFGSLAAGAESAMRKKQMKAGTHDYYGNKIK